MSNHPMEPKIDIAWIIITLAAMGLVMGWVSSFDGKPNPKRPGVRPAALICHSDGIGGLCRDDKKWRQDV